MKTLCSHVYGPLSPAYLCINSVTKDLTSELLILILNHHQINSYFPIPTSAHSEEFCQGLHISKDLVGLSPQELTSVHFIYIFIFNLFCLGPHLAELSVLHLVIPVSAQGTDYAVLRIKLEPPSRKACGARDIAWR